MNNKEHAKRNILRFVNKKKRNAENEKYIYRKKILRALNLLSFISVRIKRSTDRDIGVGYRSIFVYQFYITTRYIHPALTPQRSNPFLSSSLFFERNVGTRETTLTRKIHRNIIISSHRTNVSDDSCVDRAGNVSLFQLPGTLSRPFTLYEATVKAILFLRVTERNNR